MTIFPSLVLINICKDLNVTVNFSRMFWYNQVRLWVTLTYRYIFKKKIRLCKIHLLNQGYEQLCDY